MIVLTGDTHRDFERIFEFCELYETTKDDVMIILGDAGINYFLDENDEELKSELEQLPVTLFCVHGNHEERPFEIDTYEEKLWRGGIVYYEEEYQSLLFAKDGEIYDFNGRKTVVLGGAYSVDKYYRIANGAQWFPSEQPDEKIKADVEEKLDEVSWKVDVVLSHTCPQKYVPFEKFLPNVDQGTVDRSTEEWLDKIEDNLTYDEWYCGHFHTEKYVDRLQFMFEDFTELEG